LKATEKLVPLQVNFNLYFLFMKKIFSAFLIIALIAVSCSKDDNNTLGKDVIDYDALSDKSVELFLDFAKNPRPCRSLDKARNYLEKWYDFQ